MYRMGIIYQLALSMLFVIRYSLFPWKRTREPGLLLPGTPTHPYTGTSAPPFPEQKKGESPWRLSPAIRVHLHITIYHFWGEGSNHLYKDFLKICPSQKTGCLKKTRFLLRNRVSELPNRLTAGKATDWLTSDRLVRHSSSSLDRQKSL